MPILHYEDNHYELAQGEGLKNQKLIQAIPIVIFVSTTTWAHRFC